MVGLWFGCAEAVSQVQTIQDTLSDVIWHPLWTIAVSVGFCSFLLTGKKSLPIKVYLIAVGAHASWNFSVHYTSAVLPIPIFLTLLAILIAILGFPKLSRT